jgi:hypothetical protein
MVIKVAEGNTILCRFSGGTSVPAAVGYQHSDVEVQLSKPVVKNLFKLLIFTLTF